MSSKIICVILLLFSITILLSHHHNIEVTAADVVGKNETTKADNVQENQS